MMNKIQTGFLVKFTYLAVIVSIVYLGFLIFQPGIPSGHDIISHVYRSKIFIDALKEGQFPVRWIDSVMSNFSGPLFNFYQVGFYYLVSLVDLATSSLYFSIKAVITFSWLLGALFMFLYAKRFGNLPGALAALVFAFTPYIISDYFVRAAYPEALAISFCVGILWALDRLLTTTKKIYGIPLALCTAGLFVTHLPTAVIILPVFAGYICLLALDREIKLKGLKLFIIAGLLGIGISAFYLFPGAVRP